MYIENLFLPFIMASQHSLMHLSFLLALGIQSINDTDNVDPECTGRNAGDNIRKAFEMMVICHIACIILDFARKFFQMPHMNAHTEDEMYSTIFVVKFLDLAKLFVYFFSITYCQSKVLLYMDFREKDPKNHKMCQKHVWLLYELLYFYFSVPAMAFYVVFSRFVKLYTIRDRAGLSGDLRTKIDFIEFCRDDMHWVTTLIIQFMFLGVASFNDLGGYIPTLFILARNFINLLIVGMIFFMPRKRFNYEKVKKLSIIYMGISFLITFYIQMDYFFITSTDEGIYGLTFQLQDCIINFMTIFLAIMQYYTWPQYHKLYLMEKYVRTKLVDKSELSTDDIAKLNQSLSSVNSLSLIEDEVGHDISDENKTVKMSMHPDFYAATFYSMRKPYQKEFKISTLDQGSYYYEAIFLLTILSILVPSLWYTFFSKAKLVFVLDDNLHNLCMYFTNLASHFSLIGFTRNGLNIMRFCVYEQQQLKHPYAAFILGFLVMVVNVGCGVTILFNSLIQDTVYNMISMYVRFMLFIQVQDFYFRSRVNLPVKAAVPRDPLIIHINHDKKVNKCFYIIHQFLRSVFQSIFFYFLPFAVNINPLRYIVSQKLT